MKLDTTELYILKNSVENQTIKASDALAVGALIEKLGKEFERQVKLEEKQSATKGPAVAK